MKLHCGTQKEQSSDHGHDQGMFRIFYGDVGTHIGECKAIRRTSLL